MTAALFFGGTTLSGYSLCRLLKIKNEGLLFHCLAGTTLWWAVMEIVVIPLTLVLAPFRLFMAIYSILVGLISALGLLCWRNILEDGKQFLLVWGRYITPGYIFALLLLCGQLYFIHHHMYLEWDDAYYVNLANEAIHSDRIYWVYPETGAAPDFDNRYVLSLWPVFYAWLSKLIGISPTIMAHTVLPWIMIPLAYTVYVLIGKQLFREDYQMQGFFLSLAILVHLYMTGEHISGLTFLSLTPWVGKGVLAGILLPLLFYWLLRFSQEGTWKMGSLLCITCLAGCLLTSMGIMLVPIFVGMSVFLLAALKRSWGYLFKGILTCVPCVLLGFFYIYAVTLEGDLFIWGIFLK